MGQKINPTSFRLGWNRNWLSNWFANKKEFGNLLIEDWQIRQHLLKKPIMLGVSDIKIERKGDDSLNVIIYTTRPGSIIGKKGAGIDGLKAELSRLTKKEAWVAIEEIKRPDINAKIVADNIAKQIERRIAPRKAMKKAIQASIDAGAYGIKILLSGRIGGAEIARTEGYKEGSVPLHTLRADISYASVEAKTGYGIIGVKVWIYRGENNLVKKEA